MPFKEYYYTASPKPKWLLHLFAIKIVAIFEATHNENDVIELMKIFNIS